MGCAQSRPAAGAEAPTGAEAGGPQRSADVSLTKAASATTPGNDDGSFGTGPSAEARASGPAIHDSVHDMHGSDPAAPGAKTKTYALSEDAASKTLSDDGNRVQAPAGPSVTADVPRPAPAQPPMAVEAARYSTGSKGTQSEEAASNRSSFAVDAAPEKRGGAAASTKASSEQARSTGHNARISMMAADAMGVGGDNVPTTLQAAASRLALLPDPLPAYEPPEGLADAYRALGCLKPDTPVPAAVLKRLWGTAHAADALEIAQRFASAGVVRLASLEDGSTWALPDTRHIMHCVSRDGAVVAAAHKALLERYRAGGAGGAAPGPVGAGGGGAVAAAAPQLSMEALRDDGYILQALSHHLVGAGQLEELRRVLMDPGWLETKLHSYGSAAVVSDFRQYLHFADDEDGGVKLVLQAFQLSLGAALEHPTARMMREQMLARLMAVSHASNSLKDWYSEQAARCAADAMVHAGKRLQHLMPRTPSLTQAGGPHRMTLRGHSAPIRRVVISPNGRDVVTVSEDGTAQVWDMNIGDCVMSLQRKTPLTAVAVSPDGGIAVVGAADGTACIWDMTAGRVTLTLKGHSARITALAIDKQGIRCVTASEDHTARMWSVYDGQCEGVLSGHGGEEGGHVGAVLDVSISADGTLAVTASDDFTARVWDMDEDGQCMHVLEGHAGWVTTVAFIGTTHRAITASHDATARIWDCLKGRCLMVLEGHTGRINRVTVDPGGSWAATSSDDYSARVWDVENGRCLQVLAGHHGYVTDAAITRDGKKVVTVSGDQTGAIWDLATGTRERLLEGHSDEVRSVVLTARGRFAVTASDDCTARVWDLEAPPVTAPPCHSGRITGLKALSSGQLVVSAGDDGCVMVWDPATGTCLKQGDAHGAGVRFMAVSTDQSTCITGSGDRKICKWSWEGDAALSEAMHGAFERQEMVLRTAMATHTSTSGGLPGAVRTTRGSRSSGEGDSALFNAIMIGSGSNAPAPPGFAAGADRLYGLGLQDTRASQDSVRAHDDVALHMAPLRASVPAQQGSRVKHMSFDGACRIAAVLLFDSTVGIWDVDSGRCVRQLIKRGERDASRTHSGGVNAVYLTRDAAMAITISKDCTARVWDVATGATVVKVEGHTDGVVAADLSPDESLLATASFDKTVRITRMGKAGPPLATADGGAGPAVAGSSGRAGTTLAVLDHPAPATSLAFSPDGRRLAVALDNNTVVLWDLHQRCCLPALDSHKSAITVLLWSPDSQRVLTAGQDCTLRVWGAADGRQQAFFMADTAIASCCFAGHPHWDIIACGDAAGTIHFLDFAPELQA